MLWEYEVFNTLYCDINRQVFRLPGGCFSINLTVFAIKASRSKGFEVWIVLNAAFRVHVQGSQRARLSAGARFAQTCIPRRQPLGKEDVEHSRLSSPYSCISCAYIVRVPESAKKGCVWERWLQSFGSTAYRMDGIRRNCAREGARVGSMKSLIRRVERRAKAAARLGGSRTSRKT